jgi:hypothetical protein
MEGGAIPPMTRPLFVTIFEVPLLAAALPLVEN